MNKQIEPVRHKGVVVNITHCQTTKKGVVYESYQISDYSSGKRKRWTFASSDEARKRAREIAEATVTGQHSVLSLSPYESEIRAAFDALPPGIRLGRAVEIVRACCQIIDPDEISIACRYWKDNRPDKKFTKITLDEAIDDYLARQKHLSERRQRSLTAYFNAFREKFGKKWLHEISTANLKTLIFGKESWRAAKTRNEVRAAIGLLFRDAEEQGHLASRSTPIDTNNLLIISFYTQMVSPASAFGVAHIAHAPDVIGGYG